MANNLLIDNLKLLEKSLDEFNSKVDSHLFGKMSEPKYLNFIESNPEFAIRRQQLMDDEVKLRMKIHLMKEVLKLEDEMQQFGESEVQMVLQEQEDRQNALKTMMERFKIV